MEKYQAKRLLFRAIPQLSTITLFPHKLRWTKFALTLLKAQQYSTLNNEWSQQFVIYTHVSGELVQTLKRHVKHANIDYGGSNSGEIWNQRLPKITENPADVTVIKGDPATLRCSADGVPDPQISWFKNGNLVPIAPDDPRSHRILLPGGALFFLKVIHGRRESDNGVYWCIARNAAGIARSNNATLTVA
ncbi:hypothetical protein QYM36_012302, partial [Artemia franciscana]